MCRCLIKIMCFQVLLIAVIGMDGLITCCFTTFSTVFQSYQDDECVIMKGCVQWNLFTIERIFSSDGVNPSATGLLSQC